MNNVQLTLRNNGEGTFYILEDDEQIAKMQISIRGNILTVYHTEVAEKAEGKGYAKELLAAMVEYARTHQLKVKAFCTYVHFQLNENLEQYADVWQKEEVTK